MVALHLWVTAAVAGLATWADGQVVLASTTGGTTRTTPQISTVTTTVSDQGNGTVVNETGIILWFKPVEGAVVTEGNLSDAYEMNETLRHDCRDFSSCGVLLKQNLSRCEGEPTGYKLTFGQVRYICPCSCLFCQDSAGMETCQQDVTPSTVPARPNSTPVSTTRPFPVLLAIQDSDSDTEDKGKGYCRSGSTCAAAVAAACVGLTLAGALCMLVPIILAKRRAANQPDVGPNPNPVMTVII